MQKLIETAASDSQQDGRKVYTKPEILHELELETRAGSTIIGFGDPLNEEFNP